MDNGWKGEEPRVMGTSLVVIMRMQARSSHRVRHLRTTGSMVSSRFLDPVPKIFSVDLEWIKNYFKKSQVEQKEDEGFHGRGPCFSTVMK